MSVNQLQRQHNRSRGIDPNTSNTIEPLISTALSALFPLIVIRILLPSSSLSSSLSDSSSTTTPASTVASLDLNCSPDKRDINIGNDDIFRSSMNDCIHRAMATAMKEIDEKEQEEWIQVCKNKRGGEQEYKQNDENQHHQVIDAQHNMDASHSSSDQDSSLNEDVKYLYSSPPTSSMPLSPSINNSVPSSSHRPLVDYSQFARPLLHPQSFTQTLIPMSPLSTIPPPRYMMSKSDRRQTSKTIEVDEILYHHKQMCES